MKNYVITIARGFGSGGKEIGNKLAERLGIPCYESEILKMASDYSGISESLFNQVDEKLNVTSVIKNYFLKAPSRRMAEPMTREFTSDVNLYNIQCKIIKDLAKSESCIIIGKCADHVLRKYSNVVSVYIEAPREACLKSIMGKMGVTKEEAAKLIEKTDKYRADYYKYYTNGGYWTNPVNYDLTLNSDRIGRDRCVDLLENYIHMKFD